jgi:hypothetical protein
MAQHTVPANEVAIKALRCPEGKARIVYHVDGHGNDGLKLYVESSGTKTWYFRARVRGSDPKDMPLGRWPDVTIADARKRKSAIVVSISDGEDPWEKRAEERRSKPGIPCVIRLDLTWIAWLESGGDRSGAWPRGRGDHNALRWTPRSRTPTPYLVGLGGRGDANDRDACVEFLREQGVGSSNLPAPTNQIRYLTHQLERRATFSATL